MAETVGNPETVTIEEDQVTDKVFGSSDNFFEALEGNVNGVITDDNTEATQQEVDTNEVTQRETVGSDNVGWDDDGNPYKNATKIVVVRPSS